MSRTQVFSLFDNETGELIARNESVVNNYKLGEDWIVMYQKRLRQLAETVPNLSTIKVYMYLASAQSFDNYIYTTTKQVSLDLDMTYKTTWLAVKWLEDNHYLRRVTPNGVPAFMLNPDVTTKGAKTLQAKKAAWSMTFPVRPEVEQRETD